MRPCMHSKPIKSSVNYTIIIIKNIATQKQSIIFASKIHACYKRDNLQEIDFSSTICMNNTHVKFYGRKERNHTIPAR